MDLRAVITGALQDFINRVPSLGSNVMLDPWTLIHADDDEHIYQVDIGFRIWIDESPMAPLILVKERGRIYWDDRSLVDPFIEQLWVKAAQSLMTHGIFSLYEQAYRERESLMGEFKSYKVKYPKLIDNNQEQYLLG